MADEKPSFDEFKHQLEHLFGQPLNDQATTAANAGISTRTLDRWTAEPAFRIELEASRRAAFDEGLGALRRVAAKAVETLAGLLNSKREPERRHAAAVLLSFAFRAHEAGELEARRAALEKAAAGGPGRGARARE